MHSAQSPRRNSNSSTNSASSRDSGDSRSTAPTAHSNRPTSRHHATYISQREARKSFQREDEEYTRHQRRASVATYASTTPSETQYDDDEEDEDDGHTEYTLYDTPEAYGQAHSEPAAIPSTPLEFAEYFPSTRRLCVRHDDTVDGNMNLRIDTEVRSSGQRIDLTLFHLRMHDLKDREFSLRRYCRDSGREICNTNRKFTKPVSQHRPALHRSMSSAFASFKSKAETKPSLTRSLKRQDSGYDSMSEEERRFDNASQALGSRSFGVPTNTINIEFSNYAHVDLKRRGTKSSKRYEFEYWGTSYAWKRVVRKQGDAKEVSYLMFNSHGASPLAHIVPAPMTPAEALEEERKGGWVPPSSMWISDSKLLNGLTDVAE